jgi:hypothetical protein
MVTVALLYTSIVLTRELQHERARSTAPALTLKVAEQTDVAIAAPVSIQTPSQAPAKTDVPRENVESNENTAEAAKRRFAPGARRLLAQLQNPAMRQQLREESRGNARAGYPGLQKFLGLGNAEYLRLLDLLVEQGMATQEDGARCVLDPACKGWNADSSLRDAQQLEMAALVGADKQQRLVEYNKSLMERNNVTQLRARMPDGEPLSTQQSEMLIAALADERQRFEGELSQRGADITSVSGFATVFGFAGDRRSVDEKMADAGAYAERLRERAGKLLSRGQLAVFDEAQANSMENLRSILRQRDRDAAVGAR